MSFVTSLTKLCLTSDQQQSETVDEEKTHLYVENIILAIAETDQDVEDERKKSDAAMLKSIEAQNKLIQKLYLENSLLQNESEAVKHKPYK